MHRSIVFSALTLFLLCTSVIAQDSGFGLGAIVGEPTGLVGKLWLGSIVAIDGAVAWSFGKEGKEGEEDEEKGAFQLHTDCLLHNFEGRIRTYYGIGARIKFGDQFEDKRRVGIRVPVGVTYLFAKSPLDIFVEILPLIDLAPNTDASINGSIGLRYYFGSHGFEGKAEEYPVPDALF
jgi:hypothetical protein